MSHGLRSTRLLAAALLTIVGCSGGGGSVSKVTGSVTYNGKPVEQGFVSFQPTGEGATFGAEVVNGSYTVENGGTGQFKVTVQAGSAEAAGPAPTSREAFQSQAGTAKGKQKAADYIPADAPGNGQTVDVKEGEQTLDLTITGPPRK